jgi:hypothetical protein
VEGAVDVVEDGVVVDVIEPRATWNRLIAAELRLETRFQSSVASSRSVG